MTVARFTEFLRGANGGLEVNRLVGALGALAYIIGAQVFTAWNMVQGREFDVTAYCLAFPGGLAVLGLGTAGAVAVKDRNVALAHATESKTRTDEAGSGIHAVEKAAEEAAEQVADAAVEESDSVKGKGSKARA